MRVKSNRRDVEVVYDVVAPILALALRGLLRLRVRGLQHIPAQGPALLAANHVSYLDPVVLLVLAWRRGRRMRVMAVEEAFQRPITGWFMRAGRHIPVPEGPQKLSALRLAKEALGRGELVLVYPEGTVAAAGQEVDAKGGIGLLARQNGVPVVPIGTAGLERGGTGKKVRRPATAVIGPPLRFAETSARGRAAYVELADQMLTAVRGLVDEARLVNGDVNPSPAAVSDLTPMSDPTAR